MVKRFFQALIRAGLLILLLVLILVNMWQNNRMESKQIQILGQLEKLERRMGSGTTISRGSAGPSMANTASGMSSKSGNLLEVDPYQWSTADTKQGGTLYMKMSSDPKGLNFLIESSVDVSTIQSYVSVGLVERHHEDLTKYGPGLATYYGRSDDYKTYTFHLRDDVLWHEPAVDNASGQYNWLLNGESCREGHFINGRCRVTAHDVVFMMDMMMNNQVAGAAPIRSYFKDLESYTATDDFTLVLQFKQKTFKNNNVSKWVFPMPEFLYGFDQDGERFDEEIIGTRYSEHWYNPNGLGNGPYRFVKFQKGERVVLEKDPMYPMGNNNFDKIILQIVKDENQPQRMLRKKDLHISTLSKPQYRKQYLEADETSPFKNGDILNDSFWSWGYSYIGWNADVAFFSDKLVRQAMSHAFNADKFLEDVYLGLGKRTSGPISPDLPYYDDSLPLIPFDLDKASALLDQAGWVDTDGNGIRDKVVNGTKTDFDFGFIIVANSATVKTMGDIFKNDLLKIGVKMTLRPLEWANMQKKLHSKDFQAITLGWGTSPDIDFYQLWHSTQADIPKGSNYVGFRNAEADKIIEAMELEFDTSKRVELSQDFHRIVYDEQPYTFMFQSKNPYFYVKDLKNVSTLKVRPYFDPKPWYLSQE